VDAHLVQDAELLDQFARASSSPNTAPPALMTNTLRLNMRM
jgi:hypothetical protein